ncbi:MAG: tRNA modification GTPase [Thermodesulfobacteriota bacterium]|nr:tRNA modification GTPase [Thermodesulfobacteriota bacterium]
MTSCHPVVAACTMGSNSQEDTICAIATPIGEGGIGILKISGPEASAVAQKLFHPTSATCPLESHRLYHGWIRDPASAHPVDEVLLSYMAAPHTYTREPVVEINCHSGYAVLSRVLELVLEAGARLAEPGEFTRRAFLHGRIDLSQAEAVIEIVRSRSEQGLRAANRILRGDLSRKVESWRHNILGLQAELEASIDFCEDLEDEPVNPHLMTQDLQESVLRPLEAILHQYEEGRILREGFTMVLVGKPNVGKSSLMNALLRRDRAIVTPLPGTTRDVIEDSFILSGILVRLLDTAGIRQRPDEIESLGIERTLKSVAEADLVLWLIDGSRPLTGEDDAVYDQIVSRRYVVLLNKADLPARISVQDVQERYGSSVAIVVLSVLNPDDIESFRDFLIGAFLQDPLAMGQSMIIPNLRHKECLEQALAALRRAHNLLQSSTYGELASLELGAARRQLESILGCVPDEDLLDRIFAQFCVGK